MRSLDRLGRLALFGIALAIVAGLLAACAGNRSFEHAYSWCLAHNDVAKTGFQDCVDAQMAGYNAQRAADRQRNLGIMAIGLSNMPTSTAPQFNLPPPNPYYAPQVAPRPVPHTQGPIPTLN